jgi:spermidine synthase
VPLLLIEMLGFHRTLQVGACCNVLLACGAFALAQPRTEQHASEKRPERAIETAAGERDKKWLWVLFGTGLTSMGVEVIWIRLYTPFLSTVVYAFAAILALYLAATFAGSWLYRRRAEARGAESELLGASLGLAVLVSFFSVDPSFAVPALIRVIVGVAPLSLIVGFVTPMIVDRYSSGDPDLAGGAYAVNIVGCMIGPLLSGFLLLPLVGERLSLCLFAAPWFAAGWVFGPLLSGRKLRVALAYSSLAVSAIALVVFARGFEEQFTPRRVLRDNTATVIATGKGAGKRLMINGIGITTLTPLTKIMVHLPLAMLAKPPASALIICFGMGTSHRSALSWHIHSTAVELVPSVPELFSFYHPNGPVGLDSPLSHVVIDDGRSYLERTQEKYDVIALDPPPPTEAAASSLLYSKEFYAIAKQHLRTGGILQQWFPGGDAATQASVARALQESFRYVRAFGSIEGAGYHFLASMSPIGPATAAQLAARLPADAARDLIEWGPASTSEEEFQAVLNREVPLASVIESDPRAPALHDDRPINEYFLIRRLSQPGYLRKVPERLLGWGKPL